MPLTRTRNKDGRMRKKRCDAGTSRLKMDTENYDSIREKYNLKPSDNQIIQNALSFIENFENSGDEYIWIEELKQVLRGEDLIR